MSPLKHSSLNATLSGVESEYMTHYRGIPYGTITERYTDPIIARPEHGEELDCTAFGPRCPQIKVDAGYLLREPEGNIWFDETEDEFKCLNLDVAVPKVSSSTFGIRKGLPVLFWVHGGSQVVSYGNGASKIGDVKKLVRRSVEIGQPVIVVSAQYRLNIFHVGDSPERKNFGLKDLQCAINWVREHIAGFGGDPGEITLAGESAGGALGHALIVSGVEVKRAALMSGSLYMSAPRPDASGEAMVRKPILDRLKAKGYDLKTAPVQELVKVQAEIPILTVFLQQASDLADWATSTGNIDELIVGDCEYESVIFRNGVETLSADEIDQAFSKAGDSAARLKTLYHINSDRPTSCRAGALDLVNDVLWASPTWKVGDSFRKAGKKVYTYLFDQANPWQASARAHHAVDLLYLFEGFDISSNPSASELAREMQSRFIAFVNGRKPWREDMTCAFGPHGLTTEIGSEGVRSRRRIKQIEELQSMPTAHVMAVLPGLVAGKISLHN